MAVTVISNVLPSGGQATGARGVRWPWKRVTIDRAMQIALQEYYQAERLEEAEGDVPADSLAVQPGHAGAA